MFTQAKGESNMASVKLTKDLRAEIVNNASKDAYKAELDLLDADIAIFSAKVYRDKIVSEQIEKLADKLPNAFCVRTNAVTIRFKSQDGYGAVKQGVTLKLDKARPLPEYLRYGTFDIVDVALLQEAQTFAKRRDEINSSRNDLQTQVRGVVNSATTVDKLLEVWPECKQFIPETALTPIVKLKLPAIVVSGLNELLEKATGKPMNMAVAA
jgi:hypothetical protein